MNFSEKIKNKLQTLPDKPGVYFMRDKTGRIVYVGKAASLRSRVRSYFRQSTLRSAEPKLRGLISSIEDFDYLVVRTDAEAILTEGRMIKDYRPRYNILMKDDKRFLMIRVNLNDPFPRFEACRIDKCDGATYFGPYASSQAAWAALEFIERRFGLRLCRPRVPGPEDHKHCLNDIVRFCSAPCIGKISPEEYRERVETACAFMRGERPEFLVELHKAMEKEAAELHFEKAAALRDSLALLHRVIKERFRARKTLAIRTEDAQAGIAELQTVLHLERAPHVIEAYDISNISGTLAVASLVCAVDGVSAKNRYRLFRIKTVEGSDDPRMIAEVIRRRFERAQNEKTSLPDLVIVDGGITQMRAAKAELERVGLGQMPLAGLAKRFEEIHHANPAMESPIRLPMNSKALRVLQQLRDEAHRFALTYHRHLRLKRVRESILDEIEGIGDKRKQLLLTHFGSIARIKRASVEEIAALPGVGQALAETIKKQLQDIRPEHFRSTPGHLE
ncbi:MAG TPA: excinuclease ABC subunit C [Verrucomicrobia bacterium]|nr:excinuclease ABC subunit C [Verrucomicrobiota bacterium]